MVSGAGRPMRRDRRVCGARPEGLRKWGVLWERVGGPAGRGVRWGGAGWRLNVTVESERASPGRRGCEAVGQGWLLLQPHLTQPAEPLAN